MGVSVTGFSFSLILLAADVDSSPAPVSAVDDCSWLAGVVVDGVLVGFGTLLGVVELGVAGLVVVGGVLGGDGLVGAGLLVELPSVTLPSDIDPVVGSPLVLSEKISIESKYR